MTFTIPVWLLWIACVLGGLLVVVPLLFFALLGFLMWRDWHGQWR